MSKNVKITMVMVMSLDGIISRTDDESVAVWSSDEDKTHFHQMLQNADGIVTGRKSFKQHLIKPNKIYYIFTNNKKLQSNANLRYVSGSPQDLLENVAKDGIENLLLLGGPEVNHLFLSNNLVSDLFLTIEPKMFGAGKHLNINKELDIQLELLSCKIINKKGTMLLHYKILHTNN